MRAREREYRDNRNFSSDDDDACFFLSSFPPFFQHHHGNDLWSCVRLNSFSSSVGSCLTTQSCDRLPDCEPLVHSRVSSYISLLPSFSQFLSQISTESISHSNKVSSLIGNYRKQTSSTSSERAGGDGGGSTLEVGLARVLEEMDLGVREVGIRGEKELKLVSQVMGTTGNRLDQVRKKVSSLSLLSTLYSILLLPSEEKVD